MLGIKHKTLRKITAAALNRLTHEEAVDAICDWLKTHMILMMDAKKISSLSVLYLTPKECESVAFFLAQAVRSMNSLGQQSDPSTEGRDDG